MPGHGPVNHQVSEDQCDDEQATPAAGCWRARDLVGRRNPCVRFGDSLPSAKFIHHFRMPSRISNNSILASATNVFWQRVPGRDRLQPACDLCR